MVDRLERQILEIIGNASSLVRTVTQKEIQAGVLFPSLTAIDIKRHLPSEISLSLIDSRLNLLERDGYIFRENSRWWLTRKGRKEIGLPEDREPKVEESGKPVSRIIEEAFARHGVGEGGEMEGQGRVELLDHAFAKLEELYHNTQLSEVERSQKIRETLLELLGQSDSLRKYLSSKEQDLTAEIERLEAQLSGKRSELKQIQQLRKGT